MDIPKYIELFREDLELKNYGKETIRNYVSQINMFLIFFSKEFTELIKISERRNRIYI